MTTPNADSMPGVVVVRPHSVPSRVPALRPRLASDHLEMFASSEQIFAFLPGGFEDLAWDRRARRSHCELGASRSSVGQLKQAHSENHLQPAGGPADDFVSGFLPYRRDTRRFCDGGMVARSVGLHFWREARADTAAEKLKAMIHVTATLSGRRGTRDTPAGLGARGHH
jgi:hypothetical protein